MKEKKTKEEKIYRSADEFEKDAFPLSYGTKIKDKKEIVPGSFGSELAREFLSKIRQNLSKD